MKPDPFYSEHSHKARVPHTCSECGATIHIRAHYTKISVRRIKRGDIFVYDVCVDCLAWGQSLHTTRGGHWELGLLWTSMRDFCREVLGYDPHRRSAQ